MTYNIKEELDWILHTIRTKPEIYLLEQAIVHKSYPATVFHRWGREGEYEELYQKIRDILHIRIIEAIANEDLDRAVGLKHLSAFYSYVEQSKTDITSKGEKIDSVVFYIPDNRRDDKDGKKATKEIS